MNKTFQYFLKKELSGWKTSEILCLLFVIGIIFYNYFFLNDSIIAVISAICGITYTIIAGKGKISCYLFGLSGSGLYSYLAFTNALYGNLALYLFYYIPMQIIGILKWKNNLKEETNEIYKITLKKTERINLFIATILLCIIGIYILKLMNDGNPVIDGTTTILSIIGMYLTVKRAIEQWIIWMIVNALSVIMWLKVSLSGAHTYSTVIMWATYFILSFYFYNEWKKEI